MLHEKKILKKEGCPNPPHNKCEKEMNMHNRKNKKKNHPHPPTQLPPDTFKYSYIIFYLCRDNVPTFCLKSWDLSAQLFDGEQLAGPIPLLFAEDPDSAKAAIVASTAKAYADLQRIYRNFFMPEILGEEEAAAFVKKPR